ncbi:MAG: response regulator transcription factor [Anaerolineales bacterium]|nr:response regulator transcription factor [Anaerolineales bacterium]MCB0008793.1 response regulator transcription factor [Anaerolineales bacterium]MCB8961617.1 response regulator transcription factor [Ardenticatenales bacterium]
MSHKILLVEDDKTLQETVKYNLTRQGYDVSTASDGRAALKQAREQAPELIILDVMLPEMDGFEVCRILRKEMSVPIIMLTARTDEVDRVVGLEVGADDYLTKPFSMRELMARVKAMLRRVQLIRDELESSPNGHGESAANIETAPAGEILTFGNLTINLRRHEISLDGDPIQMKPMERELLLFLARNRGIALSRDLILERVWGWQYDSGSRTVDVHVRWLREKIEKDPKYPERIVTVRGLGYRFEG